MPKNRGSKAAGDAPRSRRARAVGDLLPHIGRASFRRFGFVQSSIVSRWSEIVGDRYAQVSVPESIRFPYGKRSDGVLRLTVSSAHATMMQHVEPAIIERVNRFFGYPAVGRIVIQHGRLPAPEPRAELPPQLRPVPAALGDSLREIADPELRACLEGLAGALGSDEGGAMRNLQLRRLGDIGRPETGSEGVR